MSISHITQALTLSTGDLTTLIANFQAEMTLGLNASPSASSLQMIPTYVFHLPKGNESGSFLSIDLGGSNFRLLRMNLLEGGICNVESKQFSLTVEHMTSTAEILFGFIADCLLEFAPETIGAANATILGFTFSFPVNNTAINRGILAQWTKGFSASGCVGEDVSELLAIELAKRNINIKVGAIINDTVGTMMAKTLDHKDCFLGLIIGTGTNACYYEQLGRIKKWEGNEAEKYQNEKGVVINIEWGNFGSGKTNVAGSGLLSLLPWTKYDQTIDAESLHPHSQLLEKMISGKYLGEIFRQVLLDAISLGLILNGKVSAEISISESVFTADISKIESNGGELSAAAEMFKRVGYADASTADCEAALQLARAVSVRAARLTAAACAAVILFTGGSAVESCTIAVDGSVFTHHPTFHAVMLEALEEIRTVSPFGPVQFANAHMGSGTGAALVVAASARENHL